MEHAAPWGYSRGVALPKAIRIVRGVEVPRFLYGTAWKEERTEPLVRLALEAGFTGIDTANQRKHYFEAAVGAAVEGWIGAGATDRSRLFLQTKFTHRDGQDQRLPYDPRAPLSEQVAQSFASSLEHLGTGYVDSYILHGPASRASLGRADWEVWRAMEALAKAGKARLIGVSNVSLQQLRVLDEAAEVRPAFVQNRCYAERGWDRQVREYCAEHDIVYQGFSLLTANRSALSGPSIRRILQETGLSLPELVFCFALEVGMLPLTGTTRPEHMRLDLGCLERQLDSRHVRTLESLAA